MGEWSTRRVSRPRLCPKGERTRARTPEIPFDDKTIFDSDSILRMERIPKSMIVVGGGVIGCEYASIFTAMGVEVTLVDGRERLLPFLDAEISELLRARLASLGLKFFFQERPKATERTAGGVRMTLASGQVVEAETALFAAGRRGAVVLGRRGGGIAAGVRDSNGPNCA